jgi:hypothetical protein
MMRILTLALLMLSALTGCWAIQDVVTNAEMDRSLPVDAEVRAGSIVARTPDRYLLEEPTKTGLSLRSASMGIPTSRYTARMEKPAVFNAALEKDRKTATYANTYHVVLQGQEREVTLLLFERKSSVELVYTTLLAGSAAEGIAVTYSTGYFHSAFGGDRWWDKPPREFVRFAESVSSER